MVHRTFDLYHFYFCFIYCFSCTKYFVIFFNNSIDFICISLISLILHCSVQERFWLSPSSLNFFYCSWTLGLPNQPSRNNLYRSFLREKEVLRFHTLQICLGEYCTLPDASSAVSAHNYRLNSHLYSCIFLL